MTYFKKIGLCLGLLWLSGCASVDTKQLQALHGMARLNLQQWSFKGRLSIKGDEVMNATLYWHHNDDKDQLKLVGMFGLGAIKIELSEQCISLARKSGEVQYSCDVDHFIAAAIGFHVPIYALRAWVVGRPVIGVDSVKSANGFEQYGWQVHYKRFQQSVYGRMPRIVVVKNGEIKLNLVIDQWGI